MGDAVPVRRPEEHDGAVAPVLTGAGLVLRPWRSDDLAVMSELFDDPEVDRWTPLEHPFDRPAAARYLARAWAAAQDGDGLQLAITTDGETPLGEVLLFDRSGDGAEIGYAVGAAHRGQGLAPRAVGLVVEHGVRVMRLHRFRLRIEPENAASRRVAAGCGFRLTHRPPEVRDVKGRRIRLDQWELHVP